MNDNNWLAYEKLVPLFPQILSIYNVEGAFIASIILWQGGLIVICCHVFWAGSRTPTAYSLHLFNKLLVNSSSSIL